MRSRASLPRSTAPRRASIHPGSTAGAPPGLGRQYGQAVGIPTFVVGIVGTEPFASYFDEFAIAGGVPAQSGTHSYFSVSNADGVAGLTTVLTDIMKQNYGCKVCAVECVDADLCTTALAFPTLASTRCVSDVSGSGLPRSGFVQYRLCDRLGDIRAVRELVSVEEAERADFFGEELPVGPRLVGCKPKIFREAWE